jgi:hypothetical protein
MRAFGLRLVLLAAFAAPLAVEAETLKVVEVNAPAVNCVFRTTCRITVTDSVGHIPLPFIAAPGTAWLQSRSFTAEPGTPGAGKTGYLYRISLTEASGSAECIGGVVLDFGPVAKLPYQTGVMADVFVITTGGLGTIGIKSATKTGNVIELRTRRFSSGSRPMARRRHRRPASGRSGTLPFTRSTRASRRIEPSRAAA